MRYLNAAMMKNLSFPDFEVEEMEFSSKNRRLRILIEGAWLDIDGGVWLGKGTLFFNEWEAVSINRYDPNDENWTPLDESSFEIIRDLCEMKFFNNSVILCGFGKQSGLWVEWKIIKGEKYAEFE